MRSSAITTAVLLPCLAWLPCILAACAGTPAKAPPASNPYVPARDGARDPLRAQALTLEAVEVMSGDPARAETLLCEALGADLWHGPAHNNLGVLYLRQDKLYEAASEFEWARKLMPGHPDPRMNLAFVLERAGRTDEALATYGTALEVFPGHMPTMQAMARLTVREGVEDERLDGWLREIALQGQTAEWREWALLEMARRGS